MVVELEPETSNPCHVAVVASPGMGHIIPLFELAKRLAGEHGLRVSFLNITAESSAAQDQLLRSPGLPPSLSVVDLPRADVTSALAATPENQLLARLCVIVEENFKPLKSVLSELGDVRALVIDPFCTCAFDVCEELSIPVYSFFTASAALFAFSLYLPVMDEEIHGEFVYLPEPVRVPGSVPIRPENLLDQVKNRKLDDYKWYLRHVSRLPRAAGVLLNTWEDLEPVTLRGIREHRFYSETVKAPPVYPVGPLVKDTEPVSEAGKACLGWLDRQPEGSVVVISLGSGGTLTAEQTTEMAWGLELSGKRFVWAARPPADVASGSFFDVGKDIRDPETFLPEGFLERTKERGVLVSSWVPQAAVLRHSATAAFVSHCGWNSTLESTTAGVAMIAWPMYAEQRMNAAILSEQAGVALWPQPDPAAGIVLREEIAKAVRAVVDGEDGKRLRRKARDLKASAAAALRDGPSYYSLSRVVNEWKA